MPDPFEFQRKLDHAGEEMEEQAMGLLEDGEEKARERTKRLIQLDADHYFDPLDRIVLLKVGIHFRNLGHRSDYMELAAEMIEEQARRQGFVPVAGGLYWNPAEKHLYVKNGGHYVLYALDRRGKP